MTKMNQPPPPTAREKSPILQMLHSEKKAIQKSAPASSGIWGTHIYLAARKILDTQFNHETNFVFKLEVF